MSGVCGTVEIGEVFWRDQQGVLKPSSDMIHSLHRIFQDHNGLLLRFICDLPRMEDPHHRNHILFVIAFYIETKRVNSIRISNPHHLPSLILPENLYRGRFLEFLEVENLILNPSLEFSAFQNLKTLYLYRVHIPNTIQSRLPRLGDIFFQSCYGVEKLGWKDSPIVKFGQDASSTFRFSSLVGLRLQTLIVTARQAIQRGVGIDLVWLKSNFPYLYKISLDGCALESLSGRCASSGFRCLTEISFNHVNIKNRDQMNSAINLLRSSPVLTLFKVLHTTFEGPDDNYVEVLTANLTFPLLRKAIISFPYGPDIFWIQLLLLNSPALDIMIIEFSERDDLDDLRMRIMNIPKPNADISFIFEARY